MLELPPLSLYIHLPWCVKKCPYCDFNSHVTDNLPEQEYLQTLKLDMAGDLEFVQGRKLESIFFGGGTPSLLSGRFYDDLLQHIAALIPFSDDIEITLEANPGTTDSQKFNDYRSAGINRLSIGVQSFQGHHLKQLGRIHSGQEALSAIDNAKSAGFTNFNLDLMHGLSGQSLEDALQDLDQAIAHAPTHLSWYQLTIEPNTEYFHRPPKLPEDELLWDIQLAGSEKLALGGYRQYEVSAFSQTGFQAKHNLNYWGFGDYIGLGAGAHSKITDSNRGQIMRYRKTRMPKDYLKTGIGFRIGMTQLSKKELGIEFLMNALRLNKGMDENSFIKRTGLPLSFLEPQLSSLRKEGLIVSDRLQASDKGHLFLNTVLEKFSI